ncbi:GAF and ANTAR domain-containing protein [Nonomuraea sp. NN258]|uniref:GAF and ANTAR domain-containing protein n=1 Tax=Nonomuraea antri TaxID=2730852 RepID=UPI001568FD4A|nr:GAF and ANTAR domain-containing protein [Nonomuraea antri]NRQ33597.1 GAF and ANTAR domain-containing protein [Nonomuraea antri]
MDARTLAAAWNDLAATFLTTDDLEQALGRITDLTAATIPGRPALSLTLMWNGRPRTIASSDNRAHPMDEIQYDGGEGPCLEAMDTGRAVLATDLACDDRWPDFSARVAGRGVRSVYSEPLGNGRGALNLYGDAPGGFPQQVRAVAQLSAEHVGILLEAALRATKQAELTEQLRQALDTRAVIDQAVGILMAQQRCDAGHALSLLRVASQHRNRKLHLVAGDIVAAVSGGPPQPPGFDYPDIS